MRVIGLLQVYNAASLIKLVLRNRYNYCDKIIVTEGRLTPCGNLPLRSTDNTRKLIQEFIIKEDNRGIVELLPALLENDLKCNNRESAEGINKRYMLEQAKPEPGDIISIIDVDEFYLPSGLEWIVERFRIYDWIKTAWPEEIQMAYNLSLGFKSIHGSRFWRYAPGDHFGNTNHLISGDGKEFTFDKRFVVPREISGVVHLSWVQHPSLIKEKVLSFNRPSFTNWYNNRFLKFPSSPDNKGFAEGHPAPLKPFTGQLPEELHDFEEDYWNLIKSNGNDYRI